MAPEGISPPEPTDPYWKRLRYLRRKAGFSQTKLYRAVDGVSLDTIRALESPPNGENGKRRGRARYPSADTLERITEALGVDPAEFPEYRLARARESLDERLVGLDEALKCYDAFLDAQERIAKKARARGARPPADTGQQRPANQHGAGNPKANGGRAS